MKEKRIKVSFYHLIFFFNVCTDLKLVNSKNMG
jgi:hypothetical protein